MGSVINYDWNSTITNDGEDYTLLPEGKAEFEVISYERGMDNKNKCSRVELKLRVWNENGSTIAKCNISLNSNFEWKLSSFFRSIGLKKHGEPFKMDFPSTPGRKGWCEITVVEIESTKKPGEKFSINNIEKFLDPPEQKESENMKF